MTQTAQPPVRTPHLSGRSGRPKRRRHSPRWASVLALTVGAIVVLFPLAWFVSIALRPATQTYQFLPTSLTLGNFGDAVDKAPELLTYLNSSTIITGGAIVLTVAVSTLAGYAFSRIRFPGSGVLFVLTLSTVFIPPATVIASLYIELVELELLDTHLGLILVYSAWQLGISTLVMRAVFNQVPKELEEAATIDGASVWQILRRIMIPLSVNGMIVVALLAFVHFWGEYIFAATFAGDAVRPMAVGMRFITPDANDVTTTFNVRAAAALFMFLPSLVIYIAFQRWFSKGLLEGALKG